METLEELKAIITGKPEGATLYDGEYFKFENDEYHRWSSIFDIQDWYIDLEPSCEVRSLSDIERIIELMERVKSGYEAYTRIEAVKQRYNAENKSKAELLLEAEILLRSGTQEHCNILADNIMEALK